MYPEEKQVLQAHSALAALRARGLAVPGKPRRMLQECPPGTRVWRVVSKHGQPDHIEGPLTIFCAGTSCSVFGETQKPMMVVRTKEDRLVQIEGCLVSCWMSGVFSSKIRAVRYLTKAKQAYASDQKWQQMHRRLARYRYHRSKTRGKRSCGVLELTVVRRQET